MAHTAPSPTGSTGKWMALTAALLGWMFDGLEMGLFPLVARPALRDVLSTTDENLVGRWFAVATAGFLVGAATGGVLFGWLGDRFGRVRAMTLSVLTYALFSGSCGFATEGWHIAVLRFIAALGMGGEWSLGVALVMEIWPNRSRAFLAGLIGAAANCGYLLVSLMGLGLGMILTELHEGLLAVGMTKEWADYLVANSGWRILMFLGTTPALLTFFIRLCVPESERWLREHEKGTTSNWASRDLLGVLVGAAAAIGFIALWTPRENKEDEFSLLVRLPGSVITLAIATVAFLHPMVQFLQRAEPRPEERRHILQRMLLGAGLSGVALLGTWASIQWASVWADQLVAGRLPEAKAWTQFFSAFGAIIGCVVGAMCGDWFGRRVTYAGLCLGALASSLLFYLGNTEYGVPFLASVCLAGGTTAAFYGWLPLYLPELFTTRVRATGQGFSFNFGRILAAIGTLQTASLMRLFEGGYPQACSIMSLIYLVGVVIIWLAPETRGQPLPE